MNLAFLFFNRKREWVKETMGKLETTFTPQGCSNCHGFTIMYIYNDRLYCQNCIYQGLFEDKPFKLIKGGKE